MNVSYIRKILAVLLVPGIAFPLGYALGIVVTDVIFMQIEVLLHDHWFFIPLPQTYFFSLIILGFIPAYLLHKFTNRLLSAALPAMAFTLYQLLEVQQYGYLGILSIGSAVSFYLLPWFVALYIGLAVWGLPKLDDKT